MSKNKVFSTPREETLTGEQMLENAIRIKQTQRQNMQALAQARKMADNNIDWVANMESVVDNTDDKSKSQIALENAYHKQGMRNIAKNNMAMRGKLLKEGTDQVWNNVIGQLIYESYWLDEPIKETTVEQIEESISSLLNYIDTKLPKTKVPESGYNKLLKNIKAVIESIVKEATDRILEEAREANDNFPEFSLTNKEEDKLDDELASLGKDEIVELIKNKVAEVIQDEKNKSAEKEELFKEIDKDTTTEEKEEDNGDSEDSEDETDAKESFNLFEGLYKPITEANGKKESLFGKVNKKWDKSMEGLENESNKKTKFVVDTTLEALKFDPTDSRYTASERYVSSILENGGEFTGLNDPTWNEFKTVITLICKKIKNIAFMENTNPCYVIVLIDDLIDKLSKLPEDIPANLKQYLMSIVSMIYGIVPPDEIVISRMRNNLNNSFDIEDSNGLDFNTISWTDLFVNIKTNLASVKSYFQLKCKHDDTQCTSKIVPSSNQNYLDSSILTKKKQMMNNNIGGSLFEAMMIGNINKCDNIVAESSACTPEDAEDVALIESLLQYTVYETLDTLGLYKFRLSDINQIKKDYIKSVTEGTIGEQERKSNKKTMSGGMGKDGKKKVRIRTNSMKPKNDN